MDNNLFYSRKINPEKKDKNNNFDFKRKKENTLNSLNEVEHFLGNYKHFIKYVKLYKLINQNRPNWPIFSSLDLFYNKNISAKIETNPITKKLVPKTIGVISPTK